MGFCMQFNDIKKLKRFKDIVTVLAKYGFDDVVDRFDVPGSDFLHTIVPIDTNLGFFERIRTVIEELGPTFIKFGQIMSLRPDLLPNELLTELEKLQDSVPALESADILQVIEKRLGRPITEVFSRFDINPIAAASLSQVHKGTLRVNGEVVAVKVQCPDIIKDVSSDLDILESISGFLDQQFQELQSYNLPEVIKTVRRILMLELDFTQEVNNNNIARSYARQTDVSIPSPYKEYSSKKLLVMEFFDGVKFRGLLDQTSYNRELIAKQGLQTIVQQIFDDGFFHADPHPGNLLVSSDMRLCIIDWGMVGRLTERDRFYL